MKIKICLIDDDKVYHLFTKKLITRNQDEDSEIIHFYDGLPALEFFIQNQNHGKKLPDIILLDLQMKEMGGWEFLEKFKGLTCKKNCIIYIVTSSIAPEDYQKSKGYSLVSGFITKPLTSTAINQILTSHAQ